MKNFSLNYLALGQRNYQTNPVLAHQRGSWEFQGILTGDCNYTTAGNDVFSSSHCLWLSRPDSTHGWSSTSTTHCTVAVFHFHRVPEPIEQLMKNRERLCIPLDRQQIQHIKSLYTQLQPQLTNPNTISSLYGERGLLDLALFFLEHDNNPVQPLAEYHKRLVNQANNLYIANLQYGWTVERVAQELKISTGHLRRVFQTVCQQPPHDVFNRKRLELAANLLSTSSHTITEIAFYCGFSSASVFSRYFKKQYNQTPRQFRVSTMQKAPLL